MLKHQKASDVCTVPSWTADAKKLMFSGRHNLALGPLRYDQGLGRYKVHYSARLCPLKTCLVAVNTGFGRSSSRNTRAA